MPVSTQLGRFMMKTNKWWIANKGGSLCTKQKPQDTDPIITRLLRAGNDPKAMTKIMKFQNLDFHCTKHTALKGIRNPTFTTGLIRLNWSNSAARYWVKPNGDVVSSFRCKLFRNTVVLLRSNLSALWPLSMKHFSYLLIYRAINIPHNAMKHQNSGLPAFES